MRLIIFSNVYYCKFNEYATRVAVYFNFNLFNICTECVQYTINNNKYSYLHYKQLQRRNKNMSHVLANSVTVWAGGKV